MKPVAQDEQRHTPGPERWWTETWCFEFHCPEGPGLDADAIAGVGGYVALTLLPNQRRAWYWAALVGPRRPLLAISDLRVPWTSRTLEIRSEGLWADHVCEESLQRWTIGNEAFAIALDDPEIALGDGRGTPTPLGFDLEWEASAEPTALEAGTAPASPEGYEISAAVHGQVLVGSERLEITGSGRWWHRWSERSWLGNGDERGGSSGDERDVRRLRAPVRIETDDEAMALDRTLGADGWRSVLRPLSPRGGGGGPRWRPAGG